MKVSNSIYLSIAMIFVIGVGAIGYTYFNKNEEVHEDTHYHAGFQVYIGDQLMDFSGEKFMHFAPCGEEDEHDETDIKDKVHLHNNIGYAAHIHADGVTWADLFTSLEFEIPQDGIVMYLNGVEHNNLMNEVMGEYDSAIFIVGDESNINTVMQNAVTKAQLLEAEAGVENCGK